MAKPFYRFIREDSDNCRTYYRDLKARLFCIQDDGSFEKAEFVFYCCSRDGEPWQALGMPGAAEFDRLVLPS